MWLKLCPVSVSWTVLLCSVMALPGSAPVVICCSGPFAPKTTHHSQGPTKPREMKKSW